MGDTYTNNWHPAVTSMAGQDQAIEDAVAMSDDNTVVVPGHGMLDDQNGLLAYKNACDQWLARLGDLYRVEQDVDVIAQDEALNRIKESFINPATAVTIPDERFKKFIRRTISAELVAPCSLPSGSVAIYEGAYRYDEDGVTEEVVVLKDKLFIRKQVPYASIVELIPRSDTKFHVRGGLDEYVLFEVDVAGIARGFQYVEGDKRWVATKVK